MQKPVFLIFLSFWCMTSFGQTTISGIVADSISGKPIEGARVFFGKTAIWGTTDETGHFQLKAKKQSLLPLVVWHPGYEKKVLQSPFSKKTLKIRLSKAANSIPPGFQKRKKQLEKKHKSGKSINSWELFLPMFEHALLGGGKASEKMEITNKEAILLKIVMHFRKVDSIIFIAQKPLIIENDHLKYRIVFYLEKAVMKPLYLKSGVFQMGKFRISGNYFFKNLLDPEKGKQKYKRRRERVFEGSLIHFMRSWKNENLTDEEFLIHNVEKEKEGEGSGLNRKSMGFSVFYENKTTEIQILKDFEIGVLGHYFPLDALEFSGDMAPAAVYSALPLDYELPN